jgi:CMP-N,N'-diacetyllegionaminic acid synthase
MTKVLGVILARGGSKGVLRKNLTPICGKPMVGYAIEHGLSARKLTHLVLSTDDSEIAAVGEGLGVRVIMRPDELATDTAPMDWALRHAVKIIEPQSGPLDFIVALYGCVPVRKNGIIDRVIDKLESTGADSVETYAAYRTPPQWSFAIDGDRLMPLEGCHKKEFRRQDLIPAYHPDGAVVAVRRDVLMQTEGMPTGSDDFLGVDRRAVVQDPNDPVDVNDPMDLLWAEFLISMSGNR